jgi:hypothetical protein
MKFNEKYGRIFIFFGLIAFASGCDRGRDSFSEKPLVSSQNAEEEWHEPNPTSDPSPKPSPSPISSAWKQMPGQGTDIGVGARGDAWMIDSSGSVQRWNGTAWEAASGRATRIDVGPRGPWAVNEIGQVFRRSGSSWQLVPTPTAALDIGVGSNGAVWITAQNQKIYRYNGNTWDLASGSAVAIDVAPDGTPWVVNSIGEIFRVVGESWIQVPGKASEISVGADGVVQIASKTTNNVGEHVLMQFTGNSFVPVDGTATALTLGSAGVAWAIRSDKSVYAVNPYIGVLSSRRGCQDNSVEGEIVTNFPNFGDSAAPRIGNAYQNGCYYSYAAGVLPDFDRYITATYSKISISKKKAEDTISDLCNQAHEVPFRVVRPDGDLLGRLEVNSNRVQIISGIVLANSFVSIVLPPNWDPSVAEGTYPILAQGFYDVNENLFAAFGEGQMIARMIAESGVDGRTGAIGLIWNGGAGMSSITANDTARLQFAQIVGLVAQYLKGNQHKILMLGGSRGGTTTLMIASNPENYDYTVSFAYAWAPGAKLGTHVRLISPTMPEQSGLGAIGFADAWKPNWRYPACGLRDYVGLSAQQANAKLLFGTSDFDRVDREGSPTSERFLKGLKRAQTRVLLDIGSHDSYIPFGTQLEYLYLLRKYKIPTEAQVFVRGGHFGDLARVEEKIWKALLSYVTPGASDEGRQVTSESTRFRQVVRVGEGVLEDFSPEGGIFPFTLEVPKKQFVTSPVVFMASGHPGTRYEVYVEGVLFLAGVIPDSWMSEHYFAGTGDYQPGTYHYTKIRIMKPGSTVWKNLDLRNTPSPDGEPLTTTLLARPNRGWGLEWSSEKVVEKIHRNNNVLANFFWTNWGVSEY